MSGKYIEIGPTQKLPERADVAEVWKKDKKKRKAQATGISAQAQS